MKQENLIFLILLVAMAVVLGSTTAVVSTLTAYAAHQEISANAGSSPQPANPESAKGSTPATTAPAGSAGQQPMDGCSAALSPVETQEVKRMLEELGHSSSALSESLKSFQEQHQIASTGILDGFTLDSIINQLSLTKARSF